MDYRSIITTDPRVRDGQPRSRGLPITVSGVLGNLASGMSIEAVLAKRRELTREDIVACLRFAEGGSDGGAAPMPRPDLAAASRRTCCEGRVTRTVDA